MMKRVALAMAGMMVLSLAGCGSSNSNPAAAAGADNVPSALLAESQFYDMKGNLLGDKAHSIVFDNAKLKRFVPGFTASISMREGIAAAVSYVTAHPESQIEDPDFDGWCDRVIEGIHGLRAIV